MFDIRLGLRSGNLFWISGIAFAYQSQLQAPVSSAGVAMYGGRSMWELQCAGVAVSGS